MNRNQQTEFAQYISKVEACLYGKKPSCDKALELLDQAEALLVASEDADMIEWAAVFGNRRFALYELGRKAEALDVCRFAIEKLHGDWAYLTEDNFIRDSIRSAHYMLAWELCESAGTLDDYVEGLKHSDACISNIAPIEDTDQELGRLQDFYLTRTRLILGAAKFDPSRRPAALEFLFKMKDEDRLGSGNAEIDEAMASPDFIELCKAEELKLADDPTIQLSTSFVLEDKTFCASPKPQLSFLSVPVNVWISKSGKSLTKRQKEIMQIIENAPAKLEEKLEFACYEIGEVYRDVMCSGRDSEEDEENILALMEWHSIRIGSNPKNLEWELHGTEWDQADGIDFYFDGLNLIGWKSWNYDIEEARGNGDPDEDDESEDEDE